MEIPIPVDDFCYFDGVKIVYCDRGKKLRELLIRTRGNPNELPNRVYQVKPDTTDIDRLMDSWQAAEELVLLTRELFQMQPFDPATGKGARDEHCWKVWEDFCEAMSETKKKPATSSPSSTPSEAAPASSPPGTSGSASS
jgi:hypothetical protein